MTQKTSIEWVQNADGTQGHSANPLRFRMKDTGKVVHFCVKTSSGCAHCYSEAMSRRWGSPEFIARNLDKVECFLDEKVLQAILRRRKPTTYFLCDMTDVFGEWVPDEFIEKIFAVMVLCPMHTFQILTKRAERMQRFVSERRGHMNGHWLVGPGISTHDDVEKWCQRNGISRKERERRRLIWSYYPDGTGRCGVPPWPGPNIWLGVSCENQPTADERIPHLLDTPAPLLGAIDLTQIKRADGWTIDALRGIYSREALEGIDHPAAIEEHGDGPRLGWVIGGGESQRGARPCHPDWARELRDQCTGTGTAFFWKQWGNWKPFSEMTEDESESLYKSNRIARDGQRQCDLDEVYGRTCTVETRSIQYDGQTGYRCDCVPGRQVPAYQVFNVGKKAAGRLLDGREWNEMPARETTEAHA